MGIVDPHAFWKLLAGMPVCMFVTRDGATLRSRPMAPSIDEAQSEIRFLTRRSSHKADEIADIGEVNLTFLDREQEDYVSVSGTASLSGDRELIRAIWTENDNTWFPEGPDGADVAVIRVSPTIAEYWDAAGGGRRYAWLSFQQEHVPAT
jgi:general stress protein 26